MAKKTQQGGSLVGTVGGIFIGAALVLFIVSILLGSLRSTSPGTVSGNGSDAISNRALWNVTNSSIDTLAGFLNIAIILFGVLGFSLVGVRIMAYITGALGGA